MSANEPRVLRAVTMQQPFAAAMAAGVGLYTRRGKTTRFADGGEPIAVHCGANDEHLLNARLMAEIRREWPACPSDAELRAGQKCVLGVARFVQGDASATAPPASTDPFLSRYICSKPVAWRADSARACATPLSYPKGQVQVWHLKPGGFSHAADAKTLRDLADQLMGGVKAEPTAGASPGKRSSAKRPNWSPVKPGEERAGAGGRGTKRPKEEPPPLVKRLKSGDVGAVKVKEEPKKAKSAPALKRSSRARVHPC